MFSKEELEILGGWYKSLVCFYDGIPSESDLAVFEKIKSLLDNHGGGELNG